MKTIKTFAAAIALATVSFTTFAAEHVSAQDAAQFEKAGVIVASGATDLSSLKSQLAAKADAAADAAAAAEVTAAMGNAPGSPAAARASTDELVERLSSLLLASSGATAAELDALRAEHVRS